MPTVTLIRHGQAGTRDNYDVLSETGVGQARLLGDWFCARGIRFDTVLSGALQRQVETARTVLGDGGFVVEPVWNEFDIDAVFTAIVPRLAADDTGFGERWAGIQAEVAGGGPEIHRCWTPTDSEVMDAWIGGRFGEIDGVESWCAFNERIRRALDGLRPAGEQKRIAVFTSALPLAFCVAEALGLDPSAILSLAGTSHNTGVTTLRLVGSDTGLLSFNVTSHLPEQLLTHR
jgi:broad specificity phosphatase PhoE